MEGALIRAVVSGCDTNVPGMGLLAAAVSMFPASEPPFHDAHMYLAFKRLLEQDVGKEGNAEVAAVAVVEAQVEKRTVDAMLSFKLVHGQWALSVIQRLYDHFACAEKGKERVKAMLDTCEAVRVHIPLAGAVGAAAGTSSSTEAGRTPLLRLTPKGVGQVIRQAF